MDAVSSQPTAPPAIAAPRSLDIHLIAIGGTGMAPLACLLKELGHRVRGSDGPLYPPMSTLLAAAGITPVEGYDPAHLEPPPDLVVVGNAVHRSNPEAVATEERGLAKLSMPEALYRFLLADRRPLVVAGTHGKTTTTAMAAYALHALGADPGYLIGGLPLDLPASFALGSGPRFVVEGDEYNAAYFDRGAKFLHYRPQTLIWTSGEFDHADLYPSHEALLAAYRKLLATLPADGVLVACGDRPEIRELAPLAPCRVLFYGMGADNDVHPAGEPQEVEGRFRCRVAAPESLLPGGAADGGVEVGIGLGGRHNLENALAVWTALVADGHAPREVARVLAGFRGVARRLQELGTEREITVVDDFAHHPTAVAATLAAMRRRYPGRRLLAALELRSLSAARSLFQDAYSEALAGADLVFLPPLFHANRLPPEERLDLGVVASRLEAAGTRATLSDGYDGILADIVAAARPGDAVVCMSSGSFGGLPRRLLAALGEQS